MTKEHLHTKLLCTKCHNNVSSLFATFVDFNTHFSSDHLQVSFYRCPTCDFDTNRSPLIKQHMMNIHCLHLTVKDVEALRFLHYRYLITEEIENCDFEPPDGATLKP